MSIKTRLVKLEKTSGDGRCIKNPLILRINRDNDFSPEEIVLLKEDDERILQEIEEGQCYVPLVLWGWSRERLAGLK
jgi:hypothetical protein